VKDTGQDPLIENLSDTDKDALISHLWQDLQAERSRSRQLEKRLLELEIGGTADEPAGTSLLDKLRRARAPEASSGQEIAHPRTGLGRGLGFLRSRIVHGAALFLVLAFALDFALGRYQHYRLDQKQAAALDLQHAAYQRLYVELVNIAQELDGKSYRVIMKMTNVEPGRSIYVMQTPVRVFEQSGLAWKEVPARAPIGETARVTRLTQAQTYETLFEPNLKDWTELMPGYMHIRFESLSLVSQRSEPDDDIVERTDRYYVYLKPYGADDEAIRRRMKYQGEPPLYIPMPPH
jgi:hypothetical protein